MKTTNYLNTFIEVADDCPVNSAEIPPKKEEKTVAQIHFDMVYDHPYQYTSDDVIFQAHAQKNKLRKEEWEEERTKFFSKGQACMRCSPLTKRYGWGVHNNEEGKIAIYPIESDEYQKLKADAELAHTKGMKSKR